MKSFFLFAALLAFPLYAQTTQPLLRELGSDDWRVRQTALDKLVHLGSTARPKIEAMLKQSKDPSVQSDLRAALRQIEDNERFGPTLLTLHLKNATPKEIFAKIADQSQATFTPGFPNLWESRHWTPISVDYDAAPFWIVVRDLCDRCGLMVNPGYNGHPGLVLYQGNNHFLSGPMAASGPYVMVASAISRSHSISYAAGGTRQSSMSLQLNLLVEPKIRILRLMMPIQLIEAEDELGHSLLDARAMRGGGGWTSGSRVVWTMSVNLEEPKGMGRKIARLKGEAHAVIISDLTTIEIPSDAKDFSRNVQGMHVALTDFKAEGNLGVFSLDCRQKEMNSSLWDLLFQAIQSGTVRVMDSKGQTLSSNINKSSRNGSKMSISFRFTTRLPFNGKTATPPYKLIWDIPKATREVSIPFEFHDLDLP